MAGTFALIIMVFFIFFACRRYKSQRSINGSSVNVLYSSREGSWRPPLEGDVDDDPYYAGNYTGIIAALQDPSPNFDHGVYPGQEEMEEVSNGHSGGHDNPPRRSLSFGRQPYMTGFGQAAETMHSGQTTNGNVSPVLSRYNSAAAVAQPMLNRNTSRGSDTGLLGHPDYAVNVYANSSPTNVSTHGYTSVHHGSRSAQSLNNVTSPPSSYGHGASSSSSGHGLVMGGKKAKKKKDSDSRPNTGSSTQSTPPTSYPYQDANNNDDKGSIRGFLGRLRGGRTSVPEVVLSPASISSRVGSRESVAGPAPVSHSHFTRRPSSLLNPPPPSLLQSYGQTDDFRHRHQSASGWNDPPSMGVYQRGSSLPSATPPPPMMQPSISEDPRLPEGLLHPHIAIIRNSSNHSSSASLRDNIDYSRPIGGVRLTCRHYLPLTDS